MTPEQEKWIKHELLGFHIVAWGIFVLIGLFIILTLSGTCHAQTLEQWEHGYKTPYVIATRYTNDVVGYNVGFEFPLNPNNCDSPKIWDFMTKNGGTVYQGGGYPGAPVFVIFKDVIDKESANVKLRRILPSLTKLIKSL